MLPAILIAWFAFGPEGAAVAAVALAPAALLLRRARPETPVTPFADHRSGLVSPAELRATLDATLAGNAASGRTTACLVLDIDDFGDLALRLGKPAAEEIARRSAERCLDAMRGGDLVARAEGGRIMVALAPVVRLDLEGMIQIAGRLQAAVARPLSLDAATIHVSASVGFCLAARLADPTGEALLLAAADAADEAGRNGAGAIRAFSPDVVRAAVSGGDLAGRVGDALEAGEFVAHFQPQLSTDTGDISGFEVLARWNHPQRGLVPPSEFLPAVEAAGKTERLTEVMVFQALTALRAWDRAGISVPGIAVNFSRGDLRNPRLVEKLKWELDRFGVAPERFTVEILETVVAETGDDVMVRNVAALAALGTGIDLDDFGTGHASIASIRRFAVSRIKIDRSFVMRADTDPGQQKMLAAILSLAERLDLQTLAEGIETHGEHAMLAQLGCTHVQGYGIGRPMPFEETIAWMDRHRAKLTAAPAIGRKAG